jgi:hypothetical protein
MFPVCVLNYKTEFAFFCFFDVENSDKKKETKFAIRTGTSTWVFRINNRVRNPKLEQNFGSQR